MSTADSELQPPHAAGSSSTTMNPNVYDEVAANAIERKWQDRWDKSGVFVAPNPGRPEYDAFFAGKPKKYILDMFPYPSGVGLHVGHPLGYIATDIYARFLRAKGFHVLHAMGYDAFGLPAEQFAVEHGVHPRITTEKNIASMRAQLHRLGLAHDPTRSVATTDVGFYRWTQWIFRLIYNSWYDPDKGKARPIIELLHSYEFGWRKAVHPEFNPDGSRAWQELTEAQQQAIIDSQRLAYLAEAPVNWCPALGTVLANEEVTADGRSERGNHPVFKRPMKQWMMRITKYAERLLTDLEPLAWPEPIKLMQRNWIGKSEGASINFASADHVADHAIRVFTTRPDTLFGATYMVLAPEHPLVDALTADNWPVNTMKAWKGSFPDRDPSSADAAVSPRSAVAAYRQWVQTRSDIQRQAEGKEKTGVFTGAFAINPATDKPIPIFIADYVLMGYGTGAIMAVPGQDQRDWDFAKAFDLPIIRTVQPPAGLPDDKPFVGDGPAINSDFLNGLGVADAKRKMIEWLASTGKGERAVTYKLRDWLFSRQRYWGEPFPIVYDEETGLAQALPESALPVELPELDDFRPSSSDDPNAPPEPPLGRAMEWARVEIDGRMYKRELNTMPQWAGSCWYYLRYLDPTNEACFVDPDIERFWMLSRKEKNEDAGAEDSRGMGVPPVRKDPRSADPSRSIGLRPVRAANTPLPPPNRPLIKKRRNLPHWTKDGCTYFITFNTQNSKELSDEERDIVLAACLHWHDTRAVIHAVIVMPDHVHMMMTPRPNMQADPSGRTWHTPSELMHSIKGFSAQEISRQRGAMGIVWQQEYFDRIIRNDGEFEDEWNYIRYNPVVAELVSQPEEYPWLWDRIRGGSHRPEAYAPPSLQAGSDEEGSHGPEAHAPRSFSPRALQTDYSESETFDPAIHHMGGVDLYVGGAEHAVLHLLYARFWHKVLFDLHRVSTPEPFGRLFNQGYIQAYAYTDERGVYVPADEVREQISSESSGSKPAWFYKGQPVNRSYGKMGKSLKNAVTPDDICVQYGCDTLRLYEMSMGPLEQSKPWNTRDIIGSQRFLQRVWRNIIDPETGALRITDEDEPAAMDEALLKIMHRTIDKVDHDMAHLSFNTAIAALIEFNNALVKQERVSRIAAEALIRMLAPLAPHIASELWERLGHAPQECERLMFEPFPVADPKYLREDTVEIPVQVLGKLRGTVTVPVNADEGTVKARAMELDKVQAHVAGKTIRKVIFLPNKLLNIVCN